MEEVRLPYHIASIVQHRQIYAKVGHPSSKSQVKPRPTPQLSFQHTMFRLNSYILTAFRIDMPVLLPLDFSNCAHNLTSIDINPDLDLHQGPGTCISANSPRATSKQEHFFRIHILFPLTAINHSSESRFLVHGSHLSRAEKCLLPLWL